MGSSNNEDLDTHILTGDPELAIFSTVKCVDTRVYVKCKQLGSAVHVHRMQVSGSMHVLKDMSSCPFESSSPFKF